MDKLSKRAAGLDLFRVFSVIMVFLFHSHIHHECSYGPFNSFISMGAIFMTAFFMLSGFVLYLTHHTQNLVEFSLLKKFYIKRIIAIIPLYYFSALVYVICFAQETIQQNILLAPVELLGIQSTFSTLFGVSHNSGTWFISCLLLAYLAYPFMQEIVKQLQTKGKILSIIICAFILWWAPLVVHGFGTDSIYSNPFFRGLEFFIGILLCSLPTKAKHLYTAKAFIAELAFLFVAVSLGVRSGFAVGNYMLYNWIALPSFALMLVTLSGLKSTRLHNSRFLRYASGASYAFFMAQTFNTEIENYIFTTWTIKSNLAMIAISITVCTAIALAMHELFEKRITGLLKSKFKNYI